MPTAAFLTEMNRQRGSQPRTKIEHITKANVVTDISSYFLEGANLETVKERAPDEIQAGQFDIVLANQDNKFSEYISGSLIFNTDYHGDRIRISQGFVLPDGTIEYEIQGIGYIDQLTTDPTESKVTFRCRDLLWRIMDQKIHPWPVVEIPIKGVGNIGNGLLTTIFTMPFETINQDWTLTCTTAGGDSVGLFSLVGSVAGSIGPVTSGTEFTNLANGIKFTVNAGSTVWQIGDVFTFSSRQYPEWNLVNAGKIIWSILTGYNWDSDTQENWAGLVFDFDRTQSSANVDLDYDSFVKAISNIGSVGFFSLKGFAKYDENAIDFLQNLLLLFIGSLFTGNDGRIKLKTYIPQFGVIEREFSDSKKVMLLGYTRTIDEIINAVSVTFVATDSWPWSNSSINLDGAYVEKDDSSIDKYNELGQSFESPWFTTNGLHVQDFANKLISKYNEPPLNIDFQTGMDALTTEIGDRILVTDTKLGLDEVIGEVALINKQFDQNPTSIIMRSRRDAEIEQTFGFIGSEIDEGDGISPQSDDFDTATDSDKSFAYFGSVATTEPDYRIF